MRERPFCLSFRSGLGDEETGFRTNVDVLDWLHDAVREHDLVGGSVVEAYPHKVNVVVDHDVSVGFFNPGADVGERDPFRCRRRLCLRTDNCCYQQRQSYDQTNDEQLFHDKSFSTIPNDERSIPHYRLKVK